MIENLLKMSAMGAIVICIVLLLRVCLRRAPKIFSYALWLIVLFRLLCPVSVALPISVFNLLPGAVRSETTIADQLPVRNHPDNQQAILSEEGAQLSDEADESVTEETAAARQEETGESGIGARIRNTFDGRSRQSYFAIVWLAGVLALLGYTCIGLMQLHKKLKCASLEKDNIYLLEGIPTPFVAGVIRPRIYLPCGLEERERTYILLHEQTHIRRGDPLFRMLAYLALTLHWFNPLVWVAFFLSGRDMEMSCDEMVLRRLGAEIKCDYSQSLLLMAQGKGFVSGIPLAFGEGDTGKRIKNVLNYKKTTVQAVIIGVLVVGLALAALGADAVERDPAENGPADDLTTEYVSDDDDVQEPVEENEEDVENAKDDALTLELLCQIADAGKLADYDYREFTNGSYDPLGDEALNYYVSFSFPGEMGDYALDFSYMKEDESLDAAYLTRQWDHEMLLVYSADSRYGAGGPPTGAEIEAFLTADYDIMNEISFDLPEGLTLEPYRADVGYAGGRLFSPKVSEGGDGTPEEWLASGMVSRFYQEDMLTWENGEINDVANYYNHTMVKPWGKVYGLEYPAFLISEDHDLYTAAEEAAKQAVGEKVDESRNRYWYLYIAKEGETYGYVISLNGKNYTADDLKALAKTIRLLGTVPGVQENQNGETGSEAVADSAVIATVPIRTVSRSARCIDNYIAPYEEWEDTYGKELFFSDDCKFFINSSRSTMNANEVDFTEFAAAIEAGDPILNKPCVLEIHNDDKLVHSITLVSKYYMNGVTYISTASEGTLFDGFFEDSMALYPDLFKDFELVRTETVDIASAPGEETIEIYRGSLNGLAYGMVNFRDKNGNMLYSFDGSLQGRCLKNIYVGRIDGGGDPFILELYLENRDTSGEYYYYVYSLGYGNGEKNQIAGSRIEWNQTGSLIYDAGEMEIFFHELGHYLYNSHLLVGIDVDNEEIRTDAVCDEKRYTYENFAPPIME